jgi:DUF1680 family protein
MRMHRRDFLKSVPVAAGAAALATTIREADAQTAKPAGEVRIGSQPFTPVRDYPIRGVRYSDVRLTDDFWKPKVDLNAAVTIPQEVKKRAGQGAAGSRGFGGNVLEAAMLSLKTHSDPMLKAQVELRVAQLLQSPGTGIGGFEVAATWFHTTGSRDLVGPATKAADALYADFQKNNPPFSGGERDATNCLALYRVTGDKKHLDLAKHYLDIRGLPSSVNRSRHNQSYKPVLEQTEAVGHAVNGVTLMVSMADVGVLAGLPAYLTAAQRMWADAVERKMYVTGGVGATGNEGFGEPYVLPNISAYAETCAVLMFMTLSHRLFLASGDAKYIDVLERGLYNNTLSGVSASGDRYFYVNRLASAGDGRDLRWERASLECCPPNLVRFLAQMPGYVYANGPAGTYINLYVSSETTVAVGQQSMGLAVRSEMPWGGKSRIAVSAKAPVKQAIKLRMPGWTRNRPAPGGLYSYADKSTKTATVALNGSPVPATPDRFGYVTLDRVWKDGDVIEVEFPMEPRQVVADPRVKATQGRVAIERGPIVYCAESPDLGGQSAHDVRLEPAKGLTPVLNRDLLGGVTTIRVQAGSVGNPKAPVGAITLIPYYLWANRGAGTSSVWLSMRDFQPGDVGPAGGFIFYVNPNPEKDGWRYLEAAPFDQSAGAKWGCFRKSIEGARGMAVGTGRQNTKDMLAACPDPGTAAHLCATLDLNGFKDWFLPSRDELALMYKNLMATGVTDFGTRGATDNFTYWSSSQQTTDMANHIDFPDLGRLHYDDKDYPRRVRAIRAI